MPHIRTLKDVQTEAKCDPHKKSKWNAKKKRKELMSSICNDIFRLLWGKKLLFVLSSSTDDLYKYQKTAPYLSPIHIHSIHILHHFFTSFLTQFWQKKNKQTKQELFFVHWTSGMCDVIKFMFDCDIHTLKQSHFPFECVLNVITAKIIISKEKKNRIIEWTLDSTD